MKNPVGVFAALAVFVGGCAPDTTCVEAAAPWPASSASAWAEVGAPRDVTLLQAPGRVVAAGDREAALQPIFRAQVVRFHVRPGDRVRAGQAVVDVIMPDVADAAAAYRGASRRRTGRRRCGSPMWRRCAGGRRRGSARRRRTARARRST
jgi:cobalt-zinc-cadmium efflux system membrane fusion protein